MEGCLTRILVLLIRAGVTAVLAGCSTTPNGEKGPESTIAFYVQVQASQEGIRVETNSVYAGKTPLTLRLFGDEGGTFHNFGAPQYIVRALPANTNRFVPTQVFRTGAGSTPGDRIPGLIFFDMEQATGSFSIDTFPH